MSGENLDIFIESEESIKNYTALRNATEKVLNNILSSDPILSDIPYDISYEEILSQIAVVKGQAITIFVERENLPTLKVIVPESNTTVLDLKKAIRRAFDLEQNRLKRRIKNSNKNKNDNDDDDTNSNNNDNIHHRHHQHQHNYHKSTKSSSSSSSSLLTTAEVVTVASSSNSNNISNNSNNNKNTNVNAIITPIKTKISWRYIWRTYLLENNYNHQPLFDDNQLLSNYGVVNKTILKFVKRCKYQKKTKTKTKTYY